MTTDHLDNQSIIRQTNPSSLEIEEFGMSMNLCIFILRVSLFTPPLLQNLEQFLSLTASSLAIISLGLLSPILACQSLLDGSTYIRFYIGNSLEKAGQERTHLCYAYWVTLNLQLCTPPGLLSVICKSSAQRSVFVSPQVGSQI